MQALDKSATAVDDYFLELKAPLAQNMGTLMQQDTVESSLWSAAAKVSLL